MVRVGKQRFAVAKVVTKSSYDATVGSLTGAGSQSAGQPNKRRLPYVQNIQQVNNNIYSERVSAHDFSFFLHIF